MSQLITTTHRSSDNNFCRECGLDLSSDDNFCRQCGKEIYNLMDDVQVTVISPAANVVRIGHANSTTTTTTSKNPDQEVAVANDSPAQTIQAILNNRLYVTMVIALIGPLGLPALWFSPRFSRRSKIISTVIFVVLTTIVPLAVAWYFLDYSLRPLVDAFGR